MEVLYIAGGALVLASLWVSLTLLHARGFSFGMHDADQEGEETSAQKPVAG
jgi:hypothetical protein